MSTADKLARYTPRTNPQPLAFKPNMEETARRWEAFYAGDLIDRPIVTVPAPKPGVDGGPGSNYREHVFGDIDTFIGKALRTSEATYFGGEAIPAFCPTIGPDEVAVFCGAELEWDEASGNTNWSKPFVEDWATALPLQLQDNHPLWRRMLEVYRRAEARMAGKMLLCPLDLHTNMDLLLSVRGGERLCLDLVDQPEMIDRAMLSARAVFPKVWRACAEAAKMDLHGYCHCAYSMEGAAMLQCDFSYLIGPEMFRRWVLPALEEEASIVKHVIYHWDGPGAIVHADDLIASKGLHTLSYVPGDGRGTHMDYLDLLQRVQKGGKAVQVWGPPDLVKQLHRHLRPEKTIYCTGAASPDEAEALLEWFVKHT
jgi:hypothetical protein